jgi:TonB family protein
VQDAAYFEKRAQESVAKGDLDAALVDYTKATEIEASAVSVLMGRGRTYTAKKTYLLAIADFTKVIDLDPKNAEAFAARAEAQEKQGNAALALDDYKRAFEIDPKIEAARAAVENDKAEQAKLVKETLPMSQPVSEAPLLPEYVDLGVINEARATKMVKPVYPPAALRSGYGGQVVVELELDSKGNVTKAKAVSGNMFLRKACEDAAEKSQFQPATVGTVAIKAKARIVYDFIARR